MFLTISEWITLVSLVVVAFTSWTARRTFVKVIWSVAFLVGLIATIIQMRSSHLESQKLEDAQLEIAHLSEYGEVATLNFKGSKSISKDYSVTSPLSGWDDGFVRDTNKGKEIRYDDQAIARYELIRKSYPKYPFSYYFLSEAYRLRCDPKWQYFAKEAVKILQITTTLPNHAPDHDDALRNLNQLLSACAPSK